MNDYKQEYRSHIVVAFIVNGKLVLSGDDETICSLCNGDCSKCVIIPCG